LNGRCFDEDDEDEDEDEDEEDSASSDDSDELISTTLSLLDFLCLFFLAIITYIYCIIS
jgi:hypothetical protein